MSLLNTIIQSIVSGILIGGIYIVISLGLDMLVGVLEITNFAHGDIVAMAMYMTFFSLQRFNLKWFQVLIFVPLFFSALGIPLYYFLFRRMVGKPYPPQLLYTTALSISIQNALLVAFSWNDRYIAIPMRVEAIKVGSIFFNKVLVLSFLISIIVSIIVFSFLYRTERGCLIRATISNRDLMSLLGIDPHGIYLQAFCLAMGLTAIGSVLLNFYYPVFPTIGSLYTSLMFVAIVLGGIGTIRGCILGGLIIGVTQIVTSTFSYVNFQNIAIFVIFIVFVVFKPQGLLGSRRRIGRRGG